MEIASAIKNNEDVTRKALLSHISTFPDAWQEKLAAALADQTDAENPAVKLRNGAPFLSSPTKDDDDIPSERRPAASIVFKLPRPL